MFLVHLKIYNIVACSWFYNFYYFRNSRKTFQYWHYLHIYHFLGLVLKQKLLKSLILLRNSIQIYTNHKIVSNRCKFNKITKLKRFRMEMYYFCNVIIFFHSYLQILKRSTKRLIFSHIILVQTGIAVSSMSVLADKLPFPYW